MYPSLRFLSAAASTLFLLWLLFRLPKLRKETIKVVSHKGGRGKLSIAIVITLAQTLILISEAVPTPQRDNGRILFAIPSVLACIGLGPLLLLEHSRSTRPSDPAVVYLIVSLACDSIELAKLVEENGVSYGAGLLLASLLLKSVLIVAESRGKAAILRDSERWSPEESAGLLARTFFWWINPILAKGNRNILTAERLPPVDQKLSSSLRRQKALQAWARSVKPENKTTLPRVLVRSMLTDFLAPVIPRFFLIAFRYAQPVLISTAIRTISKASSQSSRADYSVVLMAVAVYVGLAVSEAVYRRRLNRLRVMIRGAVVGLINNKSLSQQSNAHDDGRAVTLMSTDAESVEQAASMFHETWAQVVEVALGMAMLARQVGWAFPVPLIIIFFCSRMSRYLAKNLQGMQKDWTVATQKRIAMTISMLASMKSLKMLGIAQYSESLVNDLRIRELSRAMKVRWMMVAYNASSNALGIFSPVITLVLFVIVASWKGSALDTETAFTTTALLGLVTHPANMIMTIIPQAVGSLAAFQRIQEYFLQPPRHDQRLALKQAGASQPGVPPAIRIEGVSIQPTSSMTQILKDVNLVVKRGSIVICAGPVGSGKTTLAKAILGELPTASGTISVVSGRIAYCEQSPWLPNGTLRQAVCGFSREDQGWYNEVIRLCCLNEDLLALPNGDQTVIGSRGLNLSGGQRQRVALARAVYARYELVLLDDCFSSLDGKTESQIVDNLLGPEGHFRKAGTTVLLISNAAAHFRLADWLVILGEGTVTYQGTWADFKQDPKHALKYDISSETQSSETQSSEANEQPKLDKTLQNQSLKVAEANDDLSRATGDISLYGYYLGAVGARNFLILLACASSYSFFVTFPQYWLQKWTDAPASQTWFYVGGYLVSTVTAWVATNGSMWSTHILIAPSSGVELHRRLLSTIIGAPLLFFSTTDTGVILNRFSQDMRVVDRQLPHSVLSLSNQIFKLLVQTVFLFTAQKYLTVTLPFCAATVYFVQRIYLRTSRQLRLLDLESESAVYSSFLESVEGVMTIRAFGWEKQVEQANICCLDKSLKLDYVLYCLQQWLNIVLDLMVAAIATGLIALALLLRGTTTAGQIGMALNILLVANTTLLGLVRSWTNMEISLGAISRLKSLEANTPREDKPYEDHVPAEPWPSSGAVEFDDVTVAYNPEAVALQDVTLKISAGQQVAICGRTGSGKSTMLLTLLRLVDIKSGTIRVDGVDLSLVPRSLIRQRCFITIGQDALVLSQASLRFNLDPSSSLPDETLVAALKRTNLWKHFTGGSISVVPDPQEPTAATDILDTPIASLPQMSTGQSQLFAAARALLQLQYINNKHKTPAVEPYHDHDSATTTSAATSTPARQLPKPILLLDEATSSLDAESEAAIHAIVREEFADRGHTVIAITHRLSGLATPGPGAMQSDPGPDSVVVLLSRGKVEKVGPAADVLGVI